MIRTTTTAPLRPPLRDALATTTDWRAGLPLLGAHGVLLRELQRSDAGSLRAHVSTQEVSRFISTPPATVHGFERFIAWTQAEREAGRCAGFAVVPEGMPHAVGLFQVRQLLPSFELAEWGFAIGEAFWGAGVFAAAAMHVVDFAINTIGVRRLEARSSVLNARGVRALHRIGAVQEALLRKAFLKDGIYHDQLLWAINADDWKLREASEVQGVH